MTPSLQQKQQQQPVGVPASEKKDDLNRLYPSQTFSSGLAQEQSLDSIIVVLFCGLPASGKSTLAKGLLSQHSKTILRQQQGIIVDGEDNIDQIIYMEYVEYDQVEADLLLQQLEIEESKILESLGENDDNNEDRSKNNHASQELSAEKDANDNPPSSLSISKQNTVGKQTHETEYTRQIWKQSRGQSFQKCRNHLDKYIQLFQQERQHGFQHSGKTQTKHQSAQPKRAIILMDDNFHLRSMRRSIFKLCQDYVVAMNYDYESDNHNFNSNATITNYKDSTAENSSNNQEEQKQRAPPSLPAIEKCPQPIPIYFAVLWIDASKEICLQRNALRPSQQRVPDDVIEKMTTTLERPGKESWEQCFLRINEQTLLATNACVPLDAISQNVSTDATQPSLQEHVWNYLLHKVPNLSSPVPLPPPPVDLQALEEERRKTRENWLHRMDNTTRKWVGLVARISRRDTGKANQARKQLLQSWREQLGGKMDDTTAEQELPNLEKLIGAFLNTMKVEWTQEQRNELTTKIQELESDS